eukprot:g16908.t1
MGWCDGKYWLPWLVGMPAEMSLSMCHVMLSGVMDRFPDLKWMFSHGGGAVPGTLGRIDWGYQCRPDLVAFESPKTNPKESFKKLYLDSITHDEDMLQRLLRLTTSDRVAMGSDYPFPLGEVPSVYGRGPTSTSEHQQEPKIPLPSSRRKKNERFLISRAFYFHFPGYFIMLSQDLNDQDDAVEIVLTREAGSNDKLREAICAECEARQAAAATASNGPETSSSAPRLRLPSLRFVEAPAVRFRPRDEEDDALRGICQPGAYDWVCLTSPEAARQFVRKLLLLQETAAARGSSDGSGDHANGHSTLPRAPMMASEGSSASSGRVLLPGSTEQRSDLAAGLIARGFAVRSAAIYTTEPVPRDDDQSTLVSAGVAALSSRNGVADNFGQNSSSSSDPEESGTRTLRVHKNKQARRIWTFASPSAVNACRAWGVGVCRAACIGETTGKACGEAFSESVRIEYPAKPGVEQWAKVVVDLLAADGSQAEREGPAPEATAEKAVTDERLPKRRKSSWDEEG